MLIQFTVKNYKSFKEKAIFSLLASKYDKKELEKSNIINVEKFWLRLLKSWIIYWANASWKSKFIDAINFFKSFTVKIWFKSSKWDIINIDYFKLNDYSDKIPTEFEIIFLNNNNLYRYWFETTKNNIISEWLFYKENRKEILIFYRENNRIEKINEKYFKKWLVIKNENLLRENILLLSLAAWQLNEKWIVSDVYNRINNNLRISNWLSNKIEKYTQSQICELTDKKNEILNLLNWVNINVSNIEIETDVEKILKKMKLLSDEDKDEIRQKITESQWTILWDTLLYYKKFNKEYNIIWEESFSMEKDESSWTRKFFALTWPIIDTIENWYTLIVDELEAKLHTNLVEKIISIFNSNTLNKNNAQLIATTHNTNILSNILFRRDQIWFIEKNIYWESSLYSLSDFSIKSEENFEKNYIRWKYWATPKIKNLEYILNK